MKISLRRLTGRNFKGHRSFDVSFGHITNIYGQNESGKTSLFDAYLWLLFDKDSTGRTDFEVKTLDAANRPFHKLEHEVTAYLDIDGQEEIIRKTMREKWTKPRGQKEEVFSTHETAYFWNDVPMQLKEFSARINNLINEATFRMISNPLHFSVNLKWQERRAMLLQLAGEISDDDIAGTDPKSFKPLLDAIRGKKTMEQYRLEIAQKKRKIKEELDYIPHRIDEAKNSLPEEKDYAYLERQLKGLESELQKAESEILDKTKAAQSKQDEIVKKINERQKLNEEAINIEYQVKSDACAKRQESSRLMNDLKAQLREKEDALANVKRQSDNLKKTIDSLKAEQSKLREAYKAISGSEIKFNDADFCCPTCKRAFEAADVDAKKDELTKNFNADKVQRLAANRDKGVAMGKEIAEIESKVSDLENTQSDLNVTVEDLRNKVYEAEQEVTRLSVNEKAQVENSLLNHKQYQAVKAKVAALTEEIDNRSDSEDNEELQQRRRAINASIDSVKKDLASKEQREKTLSRIDELTEQEKKMAQELADLEGTEFTIEQFTRAKMDTLEQRINGMFKVVSFKLFDHQINGGTTETCVAMVNGVPFPDVNTAGKIAAGLDIINAISKHFDKYVPVWIDNRESVTRIPESESQVINLIVSPGDKKLRIESDAEELATA